MSLTIDTLRDVVRAAEANRPRSLQTAIGPSDAGGDCPRRIGHKIVGTARVNTLTDPWAAIVGTSVHAWLQDAFTGDRWITEREVTLPGYMSGHVDLIDTHTWTVIDHKVPGATQLKKARETGPSLQYIRQVQLYAAGLEVAGLPIEQVAIAYWSRSGNLRDSFLWTAPYDRTIAEATLARLDAIRLMLDQQGVASLPTGDAYCTYCPFYMPAATRLDEACPGHNPTQPNRKEQP